MINPWVSGDPADTVIRRLGFHYNIRSEAEGFSKGIWILWSSPQISLNIFCMTNQIVHVNIVSPFYSGAFSAMYGCPNSGSRLLLWDNIREISAGVTSNWLLGDFKSILLPKDKKEGRVVTYSQCKDFLDCLNDSNLAEVERKGHHFTWHKQDFQERIDWAICNSTFKLNYESAFIEHLPYVRSYHRPPLMHFGSHGNKQQRDHSFRFQMTWMLHPHFNDFFITH